MADLKQAVFIDRDGVINDAVYRGEHFFVKGRQVFYTAPYNYAEFQIKLGVIKAIQILKDYGFLTIVVTNQPDLKYGLITQLDYDKILRDTWALGFDDIMVCPHPREEICMCRKPKIGLFLKARDKWSIDFKQSYIVGDAEIDMQAGRNAGLKKTILVNADYNKHIVSNYRAVSLLEAVNLIMKLEKK